MGEAVATVDGEFQRHVDVAGERLAAGDVDDPEIRRAFVFLDRPLLDGEHDLSAIGRKRRATDAFEGPEILRREGTFFGGEGRRADQNEGEQQGEDSHVGRN